MTIQMKTPGCGPGEIKELHIKNFNDRSVANCTFDFNQKTAKRDLSTWLEYSEPGDVLQQIWGPIPAQRAHYGQPICEADVDFFERVHAGCDIACLLYTSPSPRDQRGSRMPSSA